MVVEVRLQLVRVVPEDWDSARVESHMNDSSWCADNIFMDIRANAGKDHCLCNVFTGAYVREATADDEEARGVSVARMAGEEDVP